jgi:predicted DNA-binding transcriptional regulator AlpA
MKQSTKNRIALLRKEKGRLLSEPEILDYMGISLPTFLAIEAEYKRRGGRLRRVSFGKKTVRFFEEDIEELIATAINQPYVLPARPRAKAAAAKASAAK